MRLIATALFSVILSSNSALAQSRPARITGMVSDSAGYPIASARVYVLGSQDTANTDPKGRFTLDNVYEGTMSLRAEFIGYLPGQRDSVVARSGKGTWVEFRLSPQPVPDGKDVFTARPVPDSN